jgi:Tfp pilus assembly protein PilE
VEIMVEVVIIAVLALPTYWVFFDKKEKEDV